MLFKRQYDMEWRPRINRELQTVQQDGFAQLTRAAGRYANPPYMSCSCRSLRR